MADYMSPVVFRLGSECYGVDISAVTGIENSLNIIHVPNAASYIKGIINLRGDVIPVYDLKRKFNMQAGTTDGTNMVIVRIGDISVALDVDHVEKIDNLDPQNVVDMPPLLRNVETQYFDRVANVAGKLIVLLDIDFLLTEEEKKVVRTVKEEMEK